MDEIAPIDRSITPEIAREIDQRVARDIAIIKAQSEAARQASAMQLSIYTALLVLGSHIIFAYAGKTLIFSDIVWSIIWCLIVAPWGGATGAKIADLIGKKLP